MRGPRSFGMITVALLLASIAGCGGDGSVPASSTSVVPPPLPHDGCEALASTRGGPVNDAGGPYFHQVVVARSSDGVTTTGARQVLDHASVPDGVRLADGTVRIYYVSGTDGAVWVARMAGDSVTPLGPVSVDGIAGPAGMVDPDATLLPDGRIRLVYLSGFGPPSGPGRSNAICIADSRDGQAFTLVGRAIQFDELATDPSLTQLSDGSWLMAVAKGRTTTLARSSDGLRFEAFDTLSFGGVSELSTLSDGRVRLYVCEQGIVSYLSADAGKTWQREATVVAGFEGKRIICDPSFVAGAGLFIFKTGDAGNPPPPAGR